MVYITPGGQGGRATQSLLGPQPEGAPAREGSQLMVLSLELFLVSPAPGLKFGVIGIFGVPS